MKKVRAVVSTILICSMALAVAACSGGKVTLKTTDEIKDACEKAGYKEDDIAVMDIDEKTAMVMAGDMEKVIITYVKSEDAEEQFKSSYDDLVDGLNDKDSFDGKHSEKEDSYIVFDGTAKQDGEEQYMYGGYYYVDGTMVVAMAMDKDGASQVKDFIKAIGYPTP
ncbi:MAG: hypothetical protein IKN14_06695 [Clostridiales bacterium]|nr:hypothetical protein [Clostridiales bacterium]